MSLGNLLGGMFNVENSIRETITRTLEDWAKFDYNDRTKFDAAISSGLAIMANQKHLYTPEKKISKLSVTFARYSNTGTTSEIIR